jgi:hypothetical protein
LETSFNLKNDAFDAHGDNKQGSRVYGGVVILGVLRHLT